MPLFICDKCGCVDNTSVTSYYVVGDLPMKHFCSECDPEIGEWHGIFPKRKATGMVLCSDGFLYSQKNIDDGLLDWRFENQGLKIVKTIE